MSYPEATELVHGHLEPAGQKRLLAAIAEVVAAAPFYRPVLPRWGTPFSVQMTNCGPLGWMSDKSGYRYQPRHPVTGEPWPPIPRVLIDLWSEMSGYLHPPEACLVNHYAAGARMGLHQDRDEADFAWPVLSISLGDGGLFRMGNTTRGGKTQSTWLMSGDVAVMGGAARLAYHGVDRIKFGTSPLMPRGGRINLTCRVVD